MIKATVLFGATGSVILAGLEAPIKKTLVICNLTIQKNRNFRDFWMVFFINAGIFKSQHPNAAFQNYDAAGSDNRGSNNRQNEVFRCMRLHKQQKILYSLLLKVVTESIEERLL